MLETMTEPLRIRQVVLGEGFPKICVPLTARDEKTLEEEAVGAVREQPDLIEWRADFFENICQPEEVEACLTMLRRVLGEIPLIFTVRTESEGGSREFSVEQYEEILRQASQSDQADLIDIEYFRNPSRMEKLIEDIHHDGKKVIGSHHNFAGTYAKQELIQRMRQMGQAKADVLKVAMMPENLDDVCDLLKATREMVQEYTKCPVVTMSMSEMGRVTRYAGEVFGSCVTFATVGEASAPGQEDIRKMREALTFYHDNFV